MGLQAAGPGILQGSLDAVILFRMYPVLEKQLSGSNFAQVEVIHTMTPHPIAIGSISHDGRHEIAEHKFLPSFILSHTKSI